MGIMDKVGDKLEELNPLDEHKKEHKKKSSGQKGGKSTHSKSKTKKTK